MLEIHPAPHKLWLSVWEGGTHLISIAMKTIYKSPGEQEFIDKLKIENDSGITLRVYLSIFNY